MNNLKIVLWEGLGCQLPFKRHLKIKNKCVSNCVSRLLVLKLSLNNYWSYNLPVKLRPRGNLRVPY